MPLSIIVFEAMLCSLMMEVCGAIGSLNASLLAGVSARRRQMQPAVHSLKAAMTVTQAALIVIAGIADFGKAMKEQLQRNDAFRIAKPALALLFGAGHEVLVESVATAAGVPHMLLAQQLTMLDSLLGFVHMLDGNDTMLAILAPLHAVMPWLRDATTALQAAPTGGPHSCLPTPSLTVKAWIES
jgi:hypothetical protein